jgi:hypothetical protein
MSRFKIELRWAFIYAGMVILWAIIGKIVGFDNAKIEYSFVFNTLILVPSFVIYLLEAFAKRKSQQEIITYRQVVLSGVVLSVFIMCLGIFTTIISAKVISPDYFSNAITFYTNNKSMTDEQAMQQFNLQAFIFNGIIGALFTGIIFSLITGFIVKKNN